MSELKILMIEDSSDQQKIFEDSVKVFNDKNQGNCKVLFEFAESQEKALQIINGSFDGAIVDLKLGDDDYGGNEIVTQFGDMLARIPVIFVTGHLDLVAEHPSIIHKRARGDSTYESDLIRFKEISDTGLTRIMGGRGKIEKVLSEVFLRNLLPQKEKWIDYGKQNSSRTEKALLRHALNHLLQLLDDDEDKSFPEEMYLFPPFTDRICTGSIVKNNAEKWFVVMNPACDLVLRESGVCNTDRILIVEIISVNSLFPNFSSPYSTSQKKELEKAFKNKKSIFYHWLPKTGFFDGGFINFRRVSTLSKDEFDQEFETPTIQISPTFVKDMIARFSGYYSRQGQPDIEFDYMLEVSQIEEASPK